MNPLQPTYHKIGFHTGIRANNQGIMDYVDQLDQAGIPAVVKTVDDVGLLKELLYRTRADIKHVFVLRHSRPGLAGEGVPDYSLHPKNAAIDYAQKIKFSLAHDIQSLRPLTGRFYYEPINEPRAKFDHDNPNYSNMHPVDWLGHFMYELTEILIDWGNLRVLGFSWNAGEPEAEDYHLPGMKRYLNAAHNNRKHYAMAFHESKVISGMEGPIEENVPHTVCRWWRLEDACDSMKLATPEIIISEFAFQHNDLPAGDVIENDLSFVSELYTQSNNLKGACLWNLQKGWDTDKKLNAQIIPITNGMLNKTVNPQIKREIHVLPQGASSANVLAAVAHAYAKRNTWTQSHDDVFSIMANARSDSIINIWSPSEFNYNPEETFQSLPVQYVEHEWSDIPGTEPPPTPPPTGSKIDILPYLMGTGILYEVQTKNGGQERMQTQIEGNIFYQTKNSLWEQLSFDHQWIYRGIDTSPGNDKFYKLIDSDQGPYSKWCPRLWKPGEQYTRHPTVEWYDKTTCKLISSAPQYSHLLFSAYYKSYSFFTGITLDNVIQLEWQEQNGSTIETYFYAKHYGLVGWESNSGRKAAISEIHPENARPDNKKETLCP